MGASISYDSKYKMSMDIDVECFTLYPAKTAHKKIGGRNVKFEKHPKQENDNDSGSGSESGSGSGSGSESGSGSGSGSESSSDSEGELQRVSVKITPEIAGYIRNYVRGREFMDIVDDITEFDLEPYGHAPNTALVFDTKSVAYDSNNKCIEALGVWDYIPPKKSSRNNKKQSGGNTRGEDSDDQDVDHDADQNGDHDGDHDHDNNTGGGKNKRNKRKQRYEQTKSDEYKTKEDELDVSNILSLIRENFNTASKNNEFIIHKTKTNVLMLNITNVDISKE
jgi:hypothetical protein